MPVYQRVLISVAAKYRKLDARSTRNLPYQTISFDTGLHRPMTYCCIYLLVHQLLKQCGNQPLNGHTRAKHLR